MKVGDIVKVTYNDGFSRGGYFSTSVYIVQIVEIFGLVGKNVDFNGKVLYRSPKLGRRFQKIGRFNRYNKIEMSSIDEIMVEEL